MQGNRPSSRLRKGIAIAAGACVASSLIVALLVVDVSAQAEPSWIEKHIAASLLDFKIRLLAPQTSATVSSADDVAVGGQIYREQCSFCHGGTDGKPALLAKSFSPRPPQFAIEPSSHPIWMNAYLIRHGIRWTAMPAFSDLSEASAWKIARFLDTQAKSRKAINR